MGRCVRADYINKTLIIIPGKCVPKERPRVNFNSGQIYTPKKTQDYEALVKSHAQMIVPSPIEGPVEAKIIVEQKMPKSWSKKKKSAVLNGDEIVMSVQDLDNMIKSVTDGLNKVAYKDDRQIMRISAEKRYSEVDQVIVILYSL